MTALGSDDASAPLRALIEKGLLATSYADRLTPEAAYERALDLSLSGGGGVAYASEASMRRQLAATGDSSTAVEAAATQLLELMSGGDGGDELARSASVAPVPSMVEARAAVQAAGLDVGMAWAALTETHEQQRRTNQEVTQHAATAIAAIAEADEVNAAVVAELTSWGFERERVVLSLQAAGGDRQVAANILLG
eukprot:COSAG05_NODE_334_length_11233_cov_697.826477_9_plen_195_part_00